MGVAHDVVATNLAGMPIIRCTRVTVEYILRNFYRGTVERDRQRTLSPSLEDARSCRRMLSRKLVDALSQDGYELDHVGEQLAGLSGDEGLIMRLRNAKCVVAQRPYHEQRQQVGRRSKLTSDRQQKVATA